MPSPKGRSARRASGGGGRRSPRGERGGRSRKTRWGGGKGGVDRDKRDGGDAGVERGGDEVRAFNEKPALGAPQAAVARELRPALHLGVVAGAQDQLGRLARNSCRALRSIWSTRSTCAAASAVFRTSA